MVLLMKPKGPPTLRFSAKGGSDFVGKDLIESDLKPIQESFIRPAPSYFLDSVANLTEGRLNSVGIEGISSPLWSHHRKKVVIGRMRFSM